MKTYHKNLTRLIIFCFFIGFAKSSIAQDTLTFDLKLNRFIPPIDKSFYLKEGKVVYIKYIHANPLGINSNPLIEGVNSIDTAGFSIIQSIITAGASANKSTEKALSNTADTLNSSNSIIKNSAALLNSKSGSKKVSQAKKDTAKYNIIQALLKEKQNEINFIESQVENITITQSQINRIIILDTILNMVLISPLVHDADDFKKLIKESSLIDDPATIKNDFNTDINTITADINRIEIAQGILQNINDELRRLDTTYTFNKYLNTLDSGLTKLRISYTGSNLVAMQNSIQSILYKYSKGTNQQYEICNKIFQVKNDVETITDTLRLQDKSIYKIIGPIDIHSYGGTRVNFSLGFAATFGNLNATSYYLIRDDSSKITGIGNSRKNSIGNFSPIAMINYVFKTKGCINPALSIGFNPDFSSFTNSRLLFGSSITFNESNSVLRRIILSGGLGMGLTDCIKPKYDGITDFTELNNISDNDLTEKAFRFGGFFSVSFNLGK